MNLPLLDDKACERARLARDPRFDGLFFTAVTSTGIYCRPVCPAPAPKPANVRYYANAAAAAGAGFRPCLRCRPELAPGAVQHLYSDVWVTAALELIADGELHEGSVASLADKIGLSTRQLRRLFLQVLSVTPLAVHTNRRLLLAKQLLTETALPMTEVALAAGFNSLRRFNAAFSEGCGMAPTAIRRQCGESPGTTLTLRLAYRPPLDFGLLLGFLGKRSIPGIERVTATSYERVVGPQDQSTWIHVTAAGTKPELLLEISTSDPRGIPAIVQRTRRMFDLDADLRPVHAALSTSSLLKSGIKRRPGLRVPGCWDGFELAVRAVIGQQISVAGATTVTRRLVDKYGAQRSGAPDGLDRVFPTPERIATAALDDIGLPKARAATLRGLAEAVLAGEVDFRAGQNLEAFVNSLTRLRGIGPWTAQYIAMRALRHPDAFPAGDLVLQQMLGGERRLSERETEAASQAWRPWRAYSVLHLWYLSGDKRATQ
jgi:AraC family transcriptional regulator of adaptative response / DNA-3-methyladenine glycosylase II